MGSLRETILVDELDRKAPFSAFGVPVNAQESIQLSSRFTEIISSRLFTRSTVGPGFGLSVVDGCLVLTSGTAIGSTTLTSKTGLPYVPGLGKVIKSSIVFDLSSPSANNTQEFGFGDAQDNIKLSLTNGVLSFKITRSGVETVSTASTAWDIPVTPTGFGNLWYLEWEWMGVGDFFIRHNGTIVHTHHFINTDTKPSFLKPSGRYFITNKNTGVAATGHSLKLLAMAAVIQGPADELINQNFNVGSTTSPTMPADVFTPILTVTFNSLAFGVENMKRANIEKLLVSCNKTAVFRVVKNASVTGGTTTAPTNSTSSPLIAPTTAFSGTNATGTAYVNTNTLAYRVTTCGTYWGSTQTESLGSPASSTLTVTNPVKQVNISWLPIDRAGFYRIYRSINGGTYSLIAEVPSYTLSFVDNSFEAITAVAPPVTSNLRGDDFMDFKVGGARTANTGSDLLVIDDLSSSVDLSDTHIYLEPGESLTVECQPTTNGTANAGFTWQGLY